MKAEDFLKLAYKQSETDYGIFLPPTNAQFGLDILIEHFLGSEWYSTAPVSTEQINTEAIYRILLMCPKKEKKKRRLFKFRKKK